MSDEQPQTATPDELLAGAEVRRAPRTHPVVFRVMAGLATGLFLGGALWGAGQVAYGLNRASLTFGVPQQLAMAQGAYYAANGKYTTDLSALSSRQDAKFSSPVGVKTEILGVCAEGWVARLDGSFPGVRTYVAGGGSANLSTAPSLTQLKLPTCITAEDLQGKGAGAAAETQQVTVRSVKIARTTMTAGLSSTNEAARVSWQASATCAAGQKPSYEVTLQEQRPSEKVSGAYPLAGEFDLRTVDTTKRAIKVTSIYNGATYAVAVRGSCTGEFAAAQPLTKSFTQALPGPYVRVRVSNGQAYPIVWGTTYPYVKYDIQYRRSYASGWTTLTTSYVRDGSLNGDGYAPNYGDQFRARTQTLDGAQTSDWGPTSTLTYSSSGGSTGYSGYQRYTPYGR